MRRALSIGTMMMFAVVSSPVLAQSGPDNVSATLIGVGEVPAVSTEAQGSFRAQIDDQGNAVDWTLTYSGLESDVLMAHIHFGQPFASGGIAVWLCKTVQSPPVTVQMCPGTRDGTLSGTFTKDDVVTIGTQGISAGDFEEVVAAIRNGLAYANVHSGNSPGGEIRGQIKSGFGH